MPSLTGFRGTDPSLLLHLLEQTASMREVLGRPVPKVPALRGRRVALVFFENSTRTRMSFDLAAKALGADVMTFTPGGSSLAKGESLLDTAQTIKALGAHCVVVRAEQVGLPGWLERHLGLPIINAGDGTNEHPTQALLDLSVLAAEWGGQWQGRTLAIVGDVSRSRVARSHLYAAKALGIAVRLIAPKTFLEPGLAERFGAAVTSNLEQGIRGADAVLLLRVQTERRGGGGPYLPSTVDYFRAWGLGEAKLKAWAPDAVVLHPGPVNRAVEIGHDLVYGAASRIQDQVTAGVAARMAVLYWALGGEQDG
jgi:aspartate carbamoyltransferase catalytic subunit